MSAIPNASAIAALEREVDDLAEVTTAILAGGLGTRLRSVVADRPKVLAEVNGRPFLTYLLDQLVIAGIRDVILCTGFLGNQIKSVFGQSYGSVSLSYSQESIPLGTAGALRLALPLFRSNPVLVMNGDSFCDTDWKSFYAWHRRRRANATLLLTRISNTCRFGQVQTTADGSVIRFEEKGGDNRPGWINGGVYLLNHRLLQEIPGNRSVSLENEVFPAWVGRRLYGFKSETRFLDIGTPESYARAASFFAGGLQA